ncbi:hypothetical protein KP509_19G030300 [Ceratopteris richardii]|uniref:acid phosphatase n=1 Tax=Ceratopteris richardii TaxID=49495 RepID=A0A8T2SJ72_CERRI|nr:hypothetical protein KP509_19G030300 [Ceratopteris richardii]
MALGRSLLPVSFKPTDNAVFYAPSFVAFPGVSILTRSVPPSWSRTGILVYRRSSAVLPAVTTMSTAASSAGSPPRIGVLFVCLGNICRSPTAEAVFRHAVENRGLQSQFNIDSAGTIDYHEGEPADARMRSSASKRGIKLTSISRPIRPSDFEVFDFILAMDKKNKEDILKAYKQWSIEYKLPPNSDKKVKLMCEFCKKFDVKEVPDPYYGGPAGFEKVLDLLEDACESLLDSLVPTMGNSPAQRT